MKENITIIEYIEKVHKAKRFDDFQKLLSIQQKLNEQDKNYRDLTDMYNQSIERNVNLEFKLSKERSKGITNSNRVDILEEENKILQEEVKVLIDQLMEELNID